MPAKGALLAFNVPEGFVVFVQHEKKRSSSNFPPFGRVCSVYTLSERKVVPHSLYIHEGFVESVHLQSESSAPQIPPHGKECSPYRPEIV